MSPSSLTISPCNSPLRHNRTQRYHEVVFPQMANWLPREEADQLCFEFAKELERIEQLLAA